jgi:hypothetical protein
MFLPLKYLNRNNNQVGLIREDEDEEEESEVDMRIVYNRNNINDVYIPLVNNGFIAQQKANISKIHKLQYIINVMNEDIIQSILKRQVVITRTMKAKIEKKYMELDYEINQLNIHRGTK